MIPGLERSLGEEYGNPTPVFLPGKSHGLRSLVGYTSWGCKRVRHDLATKTNNKKIKYAQRVRGVNVNLGVVSIEMVVLRS